jgi:predicted esterase
MLSTLSCSQDSGLKTSLAEKDKTEIYCNGDRYRKDLFSDLDIQENVLYSRNETMQGRVRDLKMDIFEPAGDSLEKRPLVIWAHGGYFCYGDKENFHSMCEFVSQKGWVSSSIAYRKWEERKLPDSLQYLETAIRATHDMHAAIRFFKADAAGPNKYRIDTTRIFVGGYSAGGVMSAQVAYLDRMEEVPGHIQQILKNNGGIYGNGGYEAHTSTIAGCIIIAGAVYDKNIISEGAKVPFLGIQGTKDDVVPYGRDWARSPAKTKVIEMDGCKKIDEMNKKTGIKSRLVSYPGGDHGAPWEGPWAEESMEAIHMFLLEGSCD